MKNLSLDTNLEEWITASLSGNLSGEEQRALDDYLAAHPEARQAYEETQAMSLLLEKTLKKDEPDPGFEDRMVRRFRSKKQARDYGFWKLWSDLWQGQKTVYAGALAALVLSLYVGGRIEDGRPAAEADAETRKRDMVPGEVNTYAGGLSADNGILEADRRKTKEAPMEEAPKESLNYLDAPDAGAKNLETSQNGRVFSGEAKSENGNNGLSDDKPGSRPDVMMGESDAAAGSRAFNGFINYGELVRGGNVPVMGDLPMVGRFFEQPAAQNAKDRTADARRPSPEPNKPESREGSAREELGKDRGSKLEKDQKELSGAQNNPAVAEPADEIQRKLIRNAVIGLEVKSYAAAVRDLTRLAQDEKGFVATQNDRTQANGRTAGQIVIKLPPDRLDGFVLRLRELGTIRNQVLKTDDVTKAYFDTEARLRNARKTEDRLLELMAKKTDKVADLLQVEKEIARVRESIEQMQGELKLWDSLASLATVTLDLVEQDMDQAAAYLLKERANLSVYSADVEKSYKEARDWAEKSEAQIVTAQVNRNEGGQMNATLSLLAAPEKAFLLVEQLKGLGRVQSFDQNTERVAQDGRSGIAGTTRRDKVEIQVSIVHDDASRKTVTLQVVTPEVEKALDQCKKAALAASGEVLASNLQRNASGHSQAVLTVRLPAKRVEETKAVFAGQGRVVRLAVQRNDNTGTNVENEDTAPVILSLTLSDEEPPVQVTRLDVEGEKVAAKVEELKTRAKGLGIEIRASSFSRSPNGVEQANLVFRMTQKEYAGMMEALLGTGKTLNLALERRDRTDSENGDSGSEPVEVLFRLKSPSPIVANENGFVGAVRHTLGKSFTVLGKSLERIVTGFAWLLPWLLSGGVVFLVWKRVRGKRNQKG